MKLFGIIIALLLTLSVQLGMAQQVQVGDLRGSYICLMDGAPASFELRVNGQDASFEFCWDTRESACKTYQGVSPIITEGKLLKASPQPGAAPKDWDDVIVEVANVEMKWRITVYSENGIDYVFERQ